MMPSTTEQRIAAPLEILPTAFAIGGRGWNDWNVGFEDDLIHFCAFRAIQEDKKKPRARGRVLLNSLWGRDAWATRKPGRRWGPSWSRSQPQSWMRKRPRRTRLLRRQNLVRKPQGDLVGSSKKGKVGGFDDQYELFLPEQSRKILRLANFERKQQTTEGKVFHEKLYHDDGSEDRGQVGQNASDNSNQYQHKSDLSLFPMRSEKSSGDHFWQPGTNRRPNLPSTSKTQRLAKGVQRKPKISKTPLKPRIFRVRRKKAMDTLMPAKKRDRKELTALDKFFPQSFFPKNQPNRKTKLSRQDGPLLDVLFPRSLFSQNQYAKTKLNSQPE